MSLEALEGATLLDLSKVNTSFSAKISNDEECTDKCDTDNSNIDNDSIEPSSPRGEGDGGVTNLEDLIDVAELPNTDDLGLAKEDIPVSTENEIVPDVEKNVFEDTDIVEGEVISCSPIPTNTADKNPCDIQLVNDEVTKSPVPPQSPASLTSPVHQSPVPQCPVNSTKDEVVNDAEKSPAVAEPSVDTSSIVTNPSETSEDSKSQLSTESEDKQHKHMNGVPEKVKEPKITKTTASSQLTPRSNKSSLLRSLPKPAPENRLAKLNKAKTASPPKKKPVSTRKPSGDDDELDKRRGNKAGLTAADPIPDSQSDFKPGEFWEAKKAIAQVKAKKTLTARKEFAQSNKLFGIKPMPHDPSPPPVRRAASKASMAGERSHTKVEPNPYGAPGEKYLTPLQQREKQVKDLHHYVATLESVIDEKDLLIESFEQQKIDSVHEMEVKKNEEVETIQNSLKKSQEEIEEVRKNLEETEKTLSKREEKINRLEKVIINMEQEYEEREQVHQERYLEMYQKGMAAMTIEHDEELVAGAQADPKSANIKQLLKKLEKTEMELAKVRESRRLEVYETAMPLESDSEARVELLKSAVYYFLTDKEPENNLKTMLSMLNYSEVQKTNIRSHIKKKKKK